MNSIRSLFPDSVVHWYRRLRYGHTWIQGEGQPLGVVFRDIYRHNLWGGTKGEFYSGPGSEADVSAAYVTAVTEFIQKQQCRTIVDVGCGDFRVGRELTGRSEVQYHCIDVVPELIARNQRQWGSSRIAFSCRDATKDGLPPGEVCLIRQVLQHLSNLQIVEILRNCQTYPYLIVTEHIWPACQKAAPNIDIHHGVETRVEFGSYVDLSQPPFCRQIDSILCTVNQPDGSAIVTAVLQRDASTPACP